MAFLDEIREYLLSVRYADLATAQSIIILGAVLAIVLSGVAIYRLYFSSLSHIPGPRLAAITDLWLLRKLYRLEKCGTIHSSFSKYGPVVRIGPNKLALNSIDAIKPVYGVGTSFVKSPWYETWSLLGQPNVFTIIDRKDHANRRRITSKLMSHNTFVKHLPAINEHVRSFAEVCAGKVKLGEQVNFILLYRYFALDVLSSTAFGKSFDLIKTGKDHPFSDDLDACVATIPPRGYLPAWLWKLISLFPNERWQFLLGGEQRLSDYSEELVKEQNSSPPKDPQTLIKAYLEHTDPDGTTLPHSVITGEIATLFFAGTDTTSNTLTFITWEIARQPYIQERLYAEAKERSTKDAIPNLDDVQTWPYLNAVIKEGLRKYAAAPSHLERVTPPGGAELQGYHIPEGTVVGVQIYSMHRNEMVYPDSESFIPERWLPENETEEMKRHFMPFGLGSRVCMGQYVAMIEIRLVLAALLRRFKIKIPAGFDYKSMEMKDFWLVFPQGHQLTLELEERTE